MTGSESILNKEPEELRRVLLEAARGDGAPRAARERALLSVTSVALGVGVASGAAAYGSPASLAKASSWLVAKWLILGLGSGVVTIAVGQGVQQLVTNHAPSAEPAVSIARNEVARVSRANIGRERASTIDAPAALPMAAASATQSTPAQGVASAPAGSGAIAPSQSGTESALQVSPSSKDVVGSLTRELSLLEQVRGALAQRSASRALRALDDYHAQFPSGSLQAESAALRVEAVGQSGDHALAKQLAASFLASYPTSPLSARVRALADTYRANAQKP